LNPLFTNALPDPASARATGRGILAHAPRRGLLIGLAASLAVHVVFSFWPHDERDVPEAVPLQATITELPPPPKPTAVAKTTPRPKPQRTTALPAPVAVPETPVADTPEAAPVEPTANALAMAAEPLAEEVPAAPSAAAPEPPPKALPRRVDLVYKAFLGTHGFLIGEAIYRFEHEGNEYRITTVGEAKGLAALFLRGQGKLESRGHITASGLQPLEFSVERGSRERRETAIFDWEAGIVTLHEDKTEALDLPTFDPLALMWQAYFSPPVDDQQTMSIATTRRVSRYTIVREGEENITWPQGEIATERWHRRSEDGKTDAYIWLAPAMRYVPIKLRVTATNRGTLEALLDSIRVDETLAQQ